MLSKITFICGIAYTIMTSKSIDILNITGYRIPMINPIGCFRGSDFQLKDGILKCDLGVGILFWWLKLPEAPRQMGLY